MSTALKACPFCGGPALDDFIPEHHSYRIECNDCDATGKICDSPELAIAAWNRRVPAPPQLMWESTTGEHEAVITDERYKAQAWHIQRWYRPLRVA